LYENIEHCKSRLLTLLREKSLRRGRFLLKSGAWSDYYIDGKQTSLDPEGAYLIGRILFETIRSRQPFPAGIGGVTLGADPLVTATSVISFMHGSPLPAFIIRTTPKDHGTRRWIEGSENLAQGGEVVLVEDVLTTGGTILEGARHVREEGFRVGAVYALIDRQEGAERTLLAQGIPLVALFTKDDLLASP
jgi:orotate phosphoribosyltransferase